jgi:hypothetical protein
MIPSGIGLLRFASALYLASRPNMILLSLLS